MDTIGHVQFFVCFFLLRRIVKYRSDFGSARSCNSFSAANQRRNKKVIGIAVKLLNNSTTVTVRFDIRDDFENSINEH